MPSGGVDFFAGGVTRSVSSSSKLGVHSWGHESDGVIKTAQDYERDSEIHIPYLDLYEQLEIPKDFYWFTIEKAPFAGMY